MHVGQAEVAAGVAVGELLVVEAQQVQDRGVQVVDVDVVLDGLEAELVGGAVDVPPLTPPPASHIGEAVVVVVAADCDLPSPPSSTVGVRPNSPPQITSVSSSMPRCFRSVSSAAIGWSHLAGELAVVRFDVVVVVPRLAGAVPDLHEAHAALEQPAGDQQSAGPCTPSPYRSRMCCGSRLTSNASAASICMR